MGEILRLNGYVTKKEVVPYGRKAAQRINFKYSVYNSQYSDHYYVFNEMGKLKLGDSLILKVSISNPAKCKVVGYYKKTADIL